MPQVAGHAKPLGLFKRSLSNSTIAHAYLLVGPPHVGKCYLATILAQALNCKGREPPCGRCSSCRRIAEGKHTDVRIVPLNPQRAEKETFTKIGTDDIKDIQYSASLPPYEGRFKVFIIDGAEHLSIEASNRLLKVLEEPLPYVVWFLLACEESRLLPTVVSRCQRVELKPVAASEISLFLRMAHDIDEKQADLLARLAAGCPGWAVNALNDDSVIQARREQLDRLITLLGTSLEDRFQYAAELGRLIDRDRSNGYEIIRRWQGFWRDVMLYKSDCRNAVTNIDYETALKELAKQADLLNIKSGIDALQQVLVEIERNVNPALALEALFLNMPTFSLSPPSPADGGLKLK